MQTDEWKKVNQILEAVLELDESEREIYFKEQKIDSKVRREVENLLSFEHEADEFLSLSARDISRDFFENEPFKENSLIGQRIGIYEIEEELGFGGMGAVYLGERVDKKFEQKVAIKMLRREFNTERVRKRFHRESEIQAKLTHPNIATLLDARTTDEGVPYLVMEFVKGVRIDKFCDENKLNLNERLKLFNKVCEAVSFAHQNLVIHRDIKPSNIFVTNRGEPKLLDFGISKLVDDSGEKTRTVTLLGAMTPEYASPEQIKGESVTTATDIYSLGVVLYKLLTGTLPYSLEDKANGKIFEEITNSKPTIPSQAIQNNSGFHLQSPKLLVGDLDNIILKAIRKEPERRYKTVEQFSADIWRFIDGLPVKARPATFSYRAKKYIGRNKIQVIAASLVFLSLIAGISIAFWQARKANEQAKIATQAQKKAEIESARSREEEERAKKITKFMEKIISYANPALYAEGGRSRGEAKVVDVLNELRDKIETDFPNRPDIQSELHHKFAEVYVIRTRYGEKSAREKTSYHARMALELRKKHYGENHELVAKDMYYLWAATHNKETPEESAKLLAKAIQIMRETDPQNANLPHMLSSYSQRLAGLENFQKLSEAYFRNILPASKLNKLELAAELMKEAVSLFEKMNSFKNNYLITSCNLGKIQIELKRYKKAEKNFAKCSEIEIAPTLSDEVIKMNNQYAKRLKKGLQK